MHEIIYEILFNISYRPSRRRVANGKVLLSVAGKRIGGIPRRKLARRGLSFFVLAKSLSSASGLSFNRPKI